MFRVAWRGLASRKLRLILTALAISLGVAFVSGTYVLTDTMSTAFTDLFQKTGAKTDVVVRSASPFDASKMTISDRASIPEGLLAAVQRVPGVRGAEGVVMGYAQVVGKDGKAIVTSGAPTFGMSAGTVPSLSTWTVRDGVSAGPTNATEMAMDAGTARSHGFKVGDRVRVLFQGPSRDFTLVSTFGFGDVDSMAGATVVVFDTQTAQDVLGKSGVFDQISISADKGYTQPQLRDAVAKMVGPKYEVVTGQTDADRTAQQVRDALGFFSTALMIFGGVALFVGAFIIFNTFSILVAQRVREFGLLRALGASSAQVTVSVLVEALVVGIVSSVLGILLGFGIAAGLYALLNAFGIDMPSTTLQFQARTGIVAFAVGVGVTVIAALAPALRTRLVSPMAALQAGFGSESEQGARRRLVIGVPVTLFGLGGLLYGMFGHTSQPLLAIGGGAVAIFVGVASLSALVSRPLASALGWPFQRVFGVTGKLGRENAMRSPARTARTAAALMIGLALVTFVSIFGASLKASALSAIDTMMRADYLVTTQNTMQAGFSPDLAAGLKRVPGVETAAEMRGGRWQRDGQVELVGAADPLELIQTFDIKVDEGSLEKIASISGVAVAQSTAARLGYHVGDVITVTMPRTGTQKLPVVAIYESGGFGVEYTISLALFERSFPQQLDSYVGIRLAPTADRAATAAAIGKLAAAYPNAKLQDSQQFKDTSAKQIDQLLGLIYTLLVLAVVISLFDIVNTLALSVFERVRELGLLRAIGMTKPDVRRMIRWESVIVALLGALLGMVVGALFGWLAVLSLHDQGLAVFSFPTAQLVVFLVLAALAGVVAAVGPARRAANVDVLQAIATT